MNAHGRWRKSSYSSGSQAGCVEMAWQELDITLRDSKNPSGPRLAFPGPSFGTFLHEVVGTLEV
jgi:hypothetical protein